MNVLVTGGAGFIGSHVVRRLVASGVRVTALDDFNNFYDPGIKRANTEPFGGRVRIVEGDIRDRALIDGLVAEGGFDTVIHLAARAGVRPSIEQPELYIDTNIKGTFYLLDACRREGIRRFIFASSSSVYGLNKKVPFAEDDCISQTISPYAATKLAGEQLCSNFAHLYGMQVVALRFFTVYGPGQRPDLAISKFTRCIEDGLPVDKYGNGSSGRDYTYVDDIVDGVIAALDYDATRFEIFNLGGSETITLNDLIAAVEAAVGKPAKINQLPDQPGDVPYTSADVTKSARWLGYAPKVSIREGIPRYVEWFRKHRDRMAAPAGAEASA